MKKRKQRYQSNSIFILNQIVRRKITGIQAAREARISPKLFYQILHEDFYPVSLLTAAKLQSTFGERAVILPPMPKKPLIV